MVLLSAVAGLLALRSPLLGLAVAALLNLVAIGAAVKTPVGVQLTAATLGPGLVSLVVSLFALLFFIRAWTARQARADAPQGFDRRTFLAAALASGEVAAVGGGGSRVFGAAGEASRARVRLPAAASKAAPVPSGARLGVRGITPYLTPTRSFYRVDTALSLPQVDARSWRLRIHGMVDKALELTFDDILARHGEREGLGQQPHRQRCQGDLRRGEDRQRHRLHDRRGDDAEDVTANHRQAQSPMPDPPARAGHRYVYPKR